MFEYSRKGLGHALIHATELVKTYGHHGACCTCVGEAGHKEDVKNAGKFARTYGDHNQTQDGMLAYVQRQQLWESVIELDVQQRDDQQSSTEGEGEAADEEPALNNVAAQVVGANCSNILHKLCEPLDAFTRGWSDMVPVDGRPPRRWGARFLSNRVLITRNELLTLMRTKLELIPNWANIILLATQLNWRCYGVAELDGDESKHRKIVGTSRMSKQRRDFVRLGGTDPVDGAALSAQVFHVYVFKMLVYVTILPYVYVIMLHVYVMLLPEQHFDPQVLMFVQVTGFQYAGVSVPDHLTQPRNNTCNSHMVTLALIRWLTPHSNAVARDEQQRPLCPAPFDINHALWTFARTNLQRRYFSDRLFAEQLHLFPGSDRNARRLNAESHKHAMYDLIHLESIKSYMNCTIDSDGILETVNLPFTL